MKVGERIKILRKELKLTQQAFAEQIGCARNLLANYEIGNRNPSSSTINNICKTFHVDEEWLRTGKGKMKADQDDKTAVKRLCEELHASELETEAIRLYFQVDPKVRDAFFRQLFHAVGEEYGISIKGPDNGDPPPDAKKPEPDTPVYPFLSKPRELWTNDDWADYGRAVDEESDGAPHGSGTALHGTDTTSASPELKTGTG